MVTLLVIGIIEEDD